MGRYWKDIREKTSGMSRQEACSYVLAYYWYHILIILSIIALIILFAVHYGLGNKKPVFTCLLVNQEMDAERDRKIADDFAGKAGLPKEQVVIDSDYHFSYGELRLEGVNESSYEKFFFQWQNQEIDAVIMSESFYRHCKEMGGGFRALEKQETEGLDVYLDEGQCTAVVLGNDSFMEKVNGRQDEKLLLAFPSSGKHETESRSFLRYLQNESEKAGREEEH